MVLPAASATMPPRPTLKDIARTAGVHISTVSLSLRGHPRIPVETRDRVKAAAQQLGYRINPLVSALMQARRSPRLVRPLALAWLGAPADPRAARSPATVFNGAAQRLRDFGFALERCSPAQALADPRRFCEHLAARQISGLLIDHQAVDTAALALEWDHLSAVTIGAPEDRPRLHHVTENLFDAVSQTLALCRARGYRRVGLVRTRAASESLLGTHALAAFALEQTRPAAVALLPPCLEAASATAFRAWFTRHAPDALLVDDAATTLAWLRPVGRRLSRDLGLVALSRQLDASASGFSFDLAAVGALAVETVLGLMHRRETGLPPLPHKISVGGVWQEHGTLPPRT